MCVCVCVCVCVCENLCVSLGCEREREGDKYTASLRLQGYRECHQKWSLTCQPTCVKIVLSPPSKVDMRGHRGGASIFLREKTHFTKPSTSKLSVRSQYHHGPILKKRSTSFSLVPLQMDMQQENAALGLALFADNTTHTMLTQCLVHRHTQHATP